MPGFLPEGDKNFISPRFGGIPGTSYSRFCLYISQNFPGEIYSYAFMSRGGVTEEDSSGFGFSVRFDFAVDLFLA